MVRSFAQSVEIPLILRHRPHQQKKKNVFQRIVDVQKERERIEREKEGHQWVEKHLAEEEMLKWEKEHAILEEHRKDVMPFFEMAEDIEKKYTILINTVRRILRAFATY